jgi:hypothetical protein
MKLLHAALAALCSTHLAMAYYCDELDSVPYNPPSSQYRTTSACSGLLADNVGFLCSVENTKIPLSRVDDGICDCCDGSDETGASNPDRVNSLLPKVACEDKCAIIRREKAAKEAELNETYRKGRFRYNQLRDEFSSGILEPATAELGTLSDQLSTLEASEVILKAKVDELAVVEEVNRVIHTTAVMNSIVDDAAADASSPLNQLTRLTNVEIASVLCYICTQLGNLNDLNFALQSHSAASGATESYDVYTSLLDTVNQQGYAYAVEDYYEATRKLLPAAEEDNKYAQLKKDIISKRTLLSKRSQLFVDAKKKLLPFIVAPEVHPIEELRSVLVKFLARARVPLAEYGYALVFALGLTEKLQNAGLPPPEMIFGDLAFELPDVVKSCKVADFPTVAREGLTIPSIDITMVMAVRCNSRFVVSQDLANNPESTAIDKIGRALPPGFGDHFPYSQATKDDALTGAVDRVSEISTYSDADTDAARDELQDAKSELRSLRKKRTELEDKVEGRRYGSDGMLSAFEDWCGLVDISKYSYEVCGFGKATQRDIGAKGGGTSLGTWKGGGFDDAGRRYVEFDGGQRCHNGPARSLKMYMECGYYDSAGGKQAEHKIVSVEEPRTCQYEAVLKSPVGCDEAWKRRVGLSPPAEGGGGSGHEEL